jgi:hypothetical protein
MPAHCGAGQQWGRGERTHAGRHAGRHAGSQPSAIIHQLSDLGRPVTPKAAAAAAAAAAGGGPASAPVYPDPAWGAERPVVDESPVWGRSGRAGQASVQSGRAAESVPARWLAITGGRSHADQLTGAAMVNHLGPVKSAHLAASAQTRRGWRALARAEPPRRRQQQRYQAAVARASPVRRRG